MREKRTYIKNAYVISMNDEKQVFENGGVLIVDDKIKAVGKIDEKEIFPDTQVIDAKAKLLCPVLSIHMYILHSSLKEVWVTMLTFLHGLQTEHSLTNQA